MENQCSHLTVLDVIYVAFSKNNKRKKKSMQKSKQVVKLWVFQLVQSLAF